MNEIITDEDAVEMKFISYGVYFASIHNEQLRKAVVKYFATIVPKYFWHVQASSTGKYHPDYASGEEGLLRHTCAAVRIAIDIMNREMYNLIFDEIDKDNIIVALMLHDTFKHGEEDSQGNYSRYSVFEHPLIAADKVRAHLEDRHNFAIAELISSHMGEWNTCKYSQSILPKPKSLPQQIVHLCDYLASRKYLEFKFK